MKTRNNSSISPPKGRNGAGTLKLEFWDHGQFASFSLILGIFGVMITVAEGHKGKFGSESIK